MGEEEDHARTLLALVGRERAPHWLPLWPIKHLGPVGGETGKGGWLLEKGDPPPRWETLPLRRLYCAGITKDRQGLGTVYIL